MDIVTLLIQLISGALGGNVAGALFKNLSLGTLGNSLAGIVGGGLGGQILGSLLNLPAVTPDMLDPMAILGQVAGGGVGGTIVMAAGRPVAQHAREIAATSSSRLGVTEAGKPAGSTPAGFFAEAPARRCASHRSIAADARPGEAAEAEALVCAAAIRRRSHGITRRPPRRHPRAPEINVDAFQQPFERLKFRDSLRRSGSSARGAHASPCLSFKARSHGEQAGRDVQDENPEHRARKFGHAIYSTTASGECRTQTARLNMRRGDHRPPRGALQSAGALKIDGLRSLAALVRLGFE